MPTANRRTFIKTAAVAAAAGVVGHAFGGGSDEIRVGLIGCGNRGSGAAENVLCAAKGVKITALGDVFKHKVYGLRDKLTEFLQKDSPAKSFGNAIDLPDERCFDGLESFEKVIASDANCIMLCTPPGFRPAHIQATVAAGKHFFTEKPVGVDGPGLRKVFDAATESEKKNLRIAAGTQRRHQFAYQDVMRRVHGGEIGDIVAMRAYWNNQGIWFHKRQPGMSDLVYQLTNWYHFLWICGDHIVEQHIHNLDVCNWAMQAHPVRCDGIGGRTGHSSARPDGPPEEVGNIFDHFSIDYVYNVNGRDVHMYSNCRHIPNTESNVSEAIVGTKGEAVMIDPKWFRINGKNLSFTPEQRERSDNRYVQEHTDLIDSIRTGKPLNELRRVAESTLTAIMGRMSAYTGRPVTWDQALNSQMSTFPEKLDWESTIPVPAVPIPGKTKLT